MLNRRYIKAIRTATLGVMATMALMWGAVDIVGVSAEALWDYVWLSIQGVLLVIALAAPFAALLYFIRRRP
jgi:hypothetical protein